MELGEEPLAGVCHISEHVTISPLISPQFFGDIFARRAERGSSDLHHQEKALLSLADAKFPHSR